MNKVEALEALEQKYEDICKAHMFSWIFHHGTGFRRVFWSNDEGVKFHYLHEVTPDYGDQSLHGTPEFFISIFAGNEGQNYSGGTPLYPYLQRMKVEADDFDLGLRIIPALAEEEYDPDRVVVYFDKKKATIGVISKDDFYSSNIPF